MFKGNRATEKTIALFFGKDWFDVDHFFKVFIEFVTVPFLFFMFCFFGHNA